MSDCDLVALNAVLNVVQAVVLALLAHDRRRRRNGSTRTRVGDG